MPSTSSAQGHRLSAATAIHSGDRAYQQDQTAFIAHKDVAGCALGVLADGMGGKSGGRKASDQVVLTAQQLFERFSPSRDKPAEALKQLVMEAHLMIKLTAITSEEEPHSTLAAFLISPNLDCHLAHAGDSRVYHYRGRDLVTRTTDHSYVQRLVDEGQLSENEAQSHPQSNLLTGCLGTVQDPPLAITQTERLQPGDCVMCCSDGLWHYFSSPEIGQILASLPPKDAAKMLIDKARQRAKGGGDNLSLVLVRVEPLGG